MRIPIRIVLGADDAYALPAAVTIRSLLDSYRSNEELEIYVLDGGMTAESRRLVLESCNGLPTFLQADRNEDVPESHLTPISRAMFLRLQIPALLPQADRAIYIDSDLLVLDDIAKLWAMPLRDGSPLGAVLSMLTPRGHTSLANKGFGESSLNFNSGVLLMDLARLRPNIGRVMDVVREGGLFLEDQDALNLVYEDQWTPLPPRWNYQVHAQFAVFGHRSAVWNVGDFFTDEEVIDMLERPAIVHFTSPLKPWHLDAARVAYAERWREIAARTAFADQVGAYAERETIRRVTWAVKRELAALGPNVDPTVATELVARARRTT